jgi:hypothetical protein
MDKLSPKPLVKSNPDITSRTGSRLDVIVLLLSLGIISALKGLNLHVDVTALYFYYTDFRFGFILRGLVGQLFSPILAALPHSAYDGVMIAWHLATLAILLIVLSRFAARTIAATGRTDVLAMAVLLFCSPLIPSLAYFTAAPDVLLCLLTLGIVAATRTQRFVLAWLIFLVGALAHQLMIFIALPVMLLGSFINADRHVPAMIGSAAVGLAACVLILLAPAPDERLVSRFIEMGISSAEAQVLYKNQLGQRSSEMLGIMADLWRQNFVNGVIAATYGASAGAVILVACLLTQGAPRPLAQPLTFLAPGRLTTILATLLVLGIGLSPLLVLAFAWDLSRLAVLSTFTAFLVADMLLCRNPVQVPLRRSRLVTFACGALALVFLGLPSISLWFSGYQLNTEKPLVRDPILEIEAIRTNVEGLLEFYNQNGL